MSPDEEIANYLRIHLDVPVYVAGEGHPEPHIIEGVTFDCDGRRCYICAKSGASAPRGSGRADD